MSLEFARADPPHPGVPGRLGLRPRLRHRDARLQRVAASRRCRRSSRPPRRVLGGANRYPDPSYVPLRRALSTATGSPPERIALGNGSCDILLAAGEALLEPGAEVVYAWPAFSVYPHLAAASGARAIEVPLDDRRSPRPRRDRRGDHGRHATGADLQPEQPDLDRGRPRPDRGVPGPGPAARVRDPRRGLLRVRARASATRTRRSSCCAATRTWCCCARSRRSTGWPALRVGYALCASEDVPHRGRPGPPAVLPERRRAGRRGRGAEASGRGRAPGDADDRARGSTSRRASAGSGCGWPSPTRTSSGCTCPRTRRGGDVVAGCATAACWCAPGRRWGARARCG